MALATVVSTWGSAPRPRGSQMAIRADGEAVGNLTGGCAEAAIIAEHARFDDDGAGDGGLDDVHAIAPLPPSRPIR